jgi:hypothetical protein
MGEFWNSFAGSRVIEQVRNATCPGASSTIADCPSCCWKKRVYLLVNCKENMICKRRRDTNGESDVYEARRRELAARATRSGVVAVEGSCPSGLQLA